MNYGALVALIQRYTKRADIDDLIPDWIRFAQLRIDTDCRLSQNEWRSVTVPKDEFISLPLDFLELRSIASNYQGGLPVEYMTPGQLEYTGRSLKSGPVQFYTITDGQLQLLPAPQADSVAQLTIFYYAKQAALAENADTTEVLKAFPNLYLYAAMVEAMPFLENRAGAQDWRGMYNDMSGTLNQAAAKARFSGATLTTRAS
jgi:hypothetical protein